MSCVEDRLSFPNKTLFSLKNKHVVNKRPHSFAILGRIFSNIFWSWTKSEAFSRVFHSRLFMKNVNFHALPAIYVRSAPTNVPAVNSTSFPGLLCSLFSKWRTEIALALAGHVTPTLSGCLVWITAECRRYLVLENYNVRRATFDFFQLFKTFWKANFHTFLMQSGRFPPISLDSDPCLNARPEKLVHQRKRRKN